MKYLIKNKKTGAILFSSQHKSQRDDYFATSAELHFSMGGTELNFNFERAQEEEIDDNKVVNLIDSDPNEAPETYIPHYSDEEIREMWEAEQEGNFNHPLLKIEEEENV
jgi:hypothetical protein